MELSEKTCCLLATGALFAILVTPAMIIAGNGPGDGMDAVELADNTSLLLARGGNGNGGGGNGSGDCDGSGSDGGNGGNGNGPGDGTGTGDKPQNGTGHGPGDGDCINT